MTQTVQHINHKDAQQDRWVSKRAAAAEIRCTTPKLDRLIQHFGLEIHSDVMNERVQLVNVSELLRKLGR